jgi:hypothetical protein
MTLIDRYLELGLRIGRHVEGFVDAYYGPPGIAERVEAEEPADPAELAATARALIEELDAAGLGEQRTRSLRGQLVALETVARRLGGEEMGYADEVEHCYGVRPQWTPETVFEAAHAALDEAIPGEGPLAERYERWKDALNVPGDVLAGALCSLARDCRARTARTIGLPEGEDVDIELVSGKPWEAFNYYRTTPSARRRRPCSSAGRAVTRRRSSSSARRSRSSARRSRRSPASCFWATRRRRWRRRTCGRSGSRTSRSWRRS